MTDEENEAWRERTLAVVALLPIEHLTKQIAELTTEIDELEQKKQIRHLLSLEMRRRLPLYPKRTKKTT